MREHHPDIFAAIDAAVGCQHCGGPLGDSPSDDFCSADHQAAWHADRADELVGYREPWDHPEELSGVGDDAYTVVTFRLPRETANLNADWRAVRCALTCATTDAQRAAVRLRVESLTARTVARQQRMATELVDAIRPSIDALGEFFRNFARSLTEAYSQLSRAFQDVPPKPSPPADVDPMARALQLRRARNTGPQRAPRPPRTIGRAATTPRR
ncbi:MAG TPA: hypothetical protein VM367_03555 [Pseudonocardia sp.]|nr:hypothetical protein [Pseudonocardia sp.]